MMVFDRHRSRGGREFNPARDVSVHLSNLAVWPSISLTLPILFRHPFEIFWFRNVRANELQLTPFSRVLIQKLIGQGTIGLS
jgi:hypothetical protein